MALGLTLLATVACDVAVPRSDSATAANRPNILIYLVDTLRADALGVYGNPVVLTPNIDAFAADSVVFENAFATSSWTRPSGASRFTGWYPRSHGTETRHDALPPGVPTLATQMRAAGYRTGFINTNPNVGSAFGFDRGFDEIIELYTRSEKGGVNPSELITPSDYASERAIQWLDDSTVPFLLVVHTIDPHNPYRPPQEFDLYGGDYDGPIDGTTTKTSKMELTEADRERVRSLYYGEVSFNDASFGTLLNALTERALLDETLVVFTSDHGEELWEFGKLGHAKSLSDVVTRVPLIVRLPAGAGELGGTRIERPVELVDLMPTLLDQVALAHPEDLGGRNLFEDAEDAAPRNLFASLILRRARLRAVRAYPYKLIRDLETDEEKLVDLRNEGAKGGEPSGPAANAARALLRAALDLHQARERRGREDAPLISVPEDVEAALRELGYVEETESDAELPRGSVERRY